MPTDFTVVIGVRQHFDDPTLDQDGWLLDEQQTAPFVGPSQDYEFECPNVLPNSDALLQFETRGVHPLIRGLMSINGNVVHGGITGGLERKLSRRSQLRRHTIF